MHRYIQKHGDRKELAKYSQRKRAYKETKKEPPYSIDSTLQQKRALTTVSLRYKIISHENKKQSRFVEAVTHNLSLTGLCAKIKSMDIDNLNMVFDKNPVMMNSIVLEIFIPGHTVPMNALGVVRWFQKSSGKGAYNYLVGIRFLKIDYG